jgi:L-alanine-DL-glutamate epimerase-like enolase superfamily enzyme
MKIINLATNYLRIPVEPAVVNITKLRPYMEIVTLKLETDEGLAGYGYTYTDGFGGRAVRTMLETDILDLLKGRDPTDIKAILALVLWETRQAGFSGITVLAAAALDFALWDVTSKASGLAIGKMLGSYRNKAPMYASIAGWSGLPVPEMVDRAKEMVDEKKLAGIKIQVGRGTPAYDELRINSLRKALGEDVRLFIDANTVLDLPSAIRLGRRLEQYDISWFEEPLPIRDHDGHQLLRDKVAIPLATGENLFGIAECDSFIRRRLVSYMQADLIRVGGITEWMRIAAIADAFGIKMAPHFVMEISVEAQCAVQNNFFVEYIPWFQSCFKKPVKVENGHVYSRTEPGLDLEFSEEALARYQVN